MADLTRRHPDMPSMFYDDHAGFVRDCHSVWAGMSGGAKAFLLQHGVPPPKVVEPMPWQLEPVEPAESSEPELPEPVPTPAPTPTASVKAARTVRTAQTPTRGKKWRDMSVSAVIRSLARDGFTLEQVQRVSESLGFGLSAKTVYCQFSGHSYRGEYADLSPADVKALKIAAKG